MALVHHLVRAAAGAVADADTVDSESMAAGIALSQWFGHEARRVYALLAEDDAEQTIRELVELVERLGGTVTPRDLQQRSRKYREAHVAENALALLKSKGYGQWPVALPPTAKGGAPKTVFVLTRANTTCVKPSKNGSYVDVDSEEWGEL